ncbi:glutathione S-transferase family protein [Microcoleus sp. FACHB-1515]|uniref:glutathione S-transferase family protein n=1 Tax=Cyanophyceae TaxID=3028117 RepID=UPI001689C586|nr:glutathione S-transferase family protein [Microcoleus sp. FACHB-1515]MBD2091558.1 glutathione S-transferase family protein [Microcoleus sp. FACHB-1515]
MYRLYDYYDSGNGYKVRLLLTQLGIPFEYIEKDILKGETRSPDFLAINPNGRIPVLEVEPDLYLAESNAILIYLSEGTKFLPEDKLDRARVMQWLFFEQYSHEPFIATSRFWLRHGFAEQKQQALQEKQALGYAALEVLEKQLKDHSFLVGDRYTIADIALYAYTHVAPQGGFSLNQFPAVQAWCDRVSKQPNYITIEAKL